MKYFSDVSSKFRSKTITSICTAVCLSVATLASAQEADKTDQSEWGEWKTSICIRGNKDHTGDFEMYRFANPDAPVGGFLKIGTTATMNNTNPVNSLADAPFWLDAIEYSEYVIESLTMRNEDTTNCADALVAEKFRYKNDLSAITYKIRPEARWHDGKPLTAEDVVYSFETLKKYNPFVQSYYRHVTEAKITGENEVTFYFDIKNNIEMPVIMGELKLIPKHYWTEEGKNRDVSKSSVDLIPYSGPYKVVKFKPGEYVEYERVEDYWGKDLNVRKGMNKIKRIRRTSYGDNDVMLEALKAGELHILYENSPKNWATKYNFDAVKRGDIVKYDLPNFYNGSGYMRGYYINLRNPKLADINLRKALVLVYPAEEINKKVFYNLYHHPRSFYDGQMYAPEGMPSKEELKYLNPYKDVLPPEVFGESYQNPDNSTPALARANQRKALKILTDAGYKLNKSTLVDPNGDPVELSLTINAASDTDEPGAIYYKQSLAKIGITLKINKVDRSQFREIRDNYKFDMIISTRGQTMDPGNEQKGYYGSTEVDKVGGRNYSGISMKILDELTAKLLLIDNYEEMTPLIRAMDRVLMAERIIVPTFIHRTAWIAAWKFLKHDKLPEYHHFIPMAWWIDENEQAELDSNFTKQ